MAAERSRGQTGAIIVGAGSGRRLGGVEKAFLPVGGRLVLAYSVAVFERTPEIDAICLVVAASSVGRGLDLVQDCSWRKVSAVVPGGPARPDSVRAGLEALPSCEWVVVHDAARPLVTAELVRAGLAAARTCGAAVAAVPVRDTLKRVCEEEDGGLVCETVDRRALWAAQTPQVFRTSVLKAAFAAAGPLASAYTDEAALVEATGQAVRVFVGAVDNIKITLPEDVGIAEALLRKREANGG